nr:hypothetical protein CFP56_00102 [Quercus suber]
MFDGNALRITYQEPKSISLIRCRFSFKFQEFFTLTAMEMSPAAYVNHLFCVRKRVNGEKTEPKETQIAERGGAYGGGGKEFQFHNSTHNEGAVTGISEVNADKETSVEGHSIRGGLAIQGEYFVEKINEIDQELMKFDLEKGNYGGHVTNETPIISDCLFNEVVKESRIPQTLVDTCELLSEPSHHVPLSSANPKKDTLHMTLTQAKPNAKLVVNDTYVTPTWKRLPRAKNLESHKTFSPQALKRSGLDIDDHELLRKKQ